MRPALVKPRAPSSNIFINYRREDSSGHAGRLFDALSVPFAGRVFMDIDTLEPGVDFVDAIEEAVGSCEVLIVVIGREWLTIQNAAGHRRLDDPADFVRLEVESALARTIRVIPVLVQEAPMPSAEELPASMARLARRNAIELSDVRWAYDVERLVHTIQEILAEKEPVAPVPAVAPEGTVAAKARRPTVWLLSLAAPLLLVAAVLFFWTHVWRQESSAPRRVPPVSGPGRQAPPVEPSITPDVQPPQAAITSPLSGARVGSSVQVEGTILDLGDRRAFLCIRPSNGAIYPRGELFLTDGRFSILLRSSKETTFEILVVTTAGQKAAQVLSDQRSRDNGMPVLPSGASVSSGFVTVKRQGKIRNLLTPD